MSEAFAHIIEYRAILMDNFARQPAELVALIHALPEADAHSRRVPQGHSLHQVVAHVREVEVQAFLPRLRRILAEDRPMLEPYTSPEWTSEAYQADEPLAQILDDFARARAEAVALMRSMTLADWTRCGFHPPAGWRTAQWWIERIYRHARAHVAQIRQAVTAQ